MSRIVDTDLGQFRYVTDGHKSWFLFECPVCHEMLPMDEETLAGRKPITHESLINRASYCTFAGTHPLGENLVAAMQANILMGYQPYHEEGHDNYASRRGGVDGPL